MKNTTTKLLLVFATATSSTIAYAEDGAFTPELNALTQIQDPTDGDTATASVPAPGLGPAIAESILSNRAAFASASYTELNVFASVTSGSPTSSTEGFAVARGGINDLITIDPAGVPTGTVRVRTVWQVDGTVAGSAASFKFASSFDPNATAFTTSAGQFVFDQPGGVNQLVTFDYVDVPVGEAWSLTVRAEAVAGSDLAGEVDFSNSAKLLSTTLFINDAEVATRITGAGGAVYAIPEPSSLALLGLGGLLIARRRSRN